MPVLEHHHRLLMDQDEDEDRASRRSAPERSVSFNRDVHVKRIGELLAGVGKNYSHLQCRVSVALEQ